MARTLMGLFLLTFVTIGCQPAPSDGSHQNADPAPTEGASSVDMSDPNKVPEMDMGTETRKE